MGEFRGKLYIFVDASRADEGATSINEPGHVFGNCSPGEMQWYLIGWAVGKTARGAYCARTSTTKLRSFGTFAEAMGFVRKKRKTRPDEQFHLVYDLDGRKSIVTSLEQILQMSGQTDHAGHSAHHDVANHPKLDALTEKVGKIVATNALVLLKTLDQEGASAAKTRFSGATYERLWQVLRDAALVEARPSS